MPTQTAAAPPGATAEDLRFLDRHGSKLSKSTMRANWMRRLGDKPDRSGQALATRSPEVIRDWSERRKATPVAATRGPEGKPRTLRLDFGDTGVRDGRGRLRESISWDDWLRVFQDRKLVFLYQERSRDGSDSSFFRLDSPTREEG